MSRNTNPSLPGATEDASERMNAARGLVYGTLAGIGLWLAAAVVTAVAARLLL